MSAPKFALQAPGAFSVIILGVMGHVGLVYFPSGVDPAHAQDADIRYGVELRLPFRIRATGLVNLGHEHGAAEVWFFNEIAIPPGAHLPGILFDLRKADPQGGYTRLWTRVVVMLNSPTLAPGVADEVRGGEVGSEHIGQVGNPFAALGVLNDIIHGYSDALDTLFGGAHVRFLSDMEFMQAVRQEFAYVASPAYRLSEDDVREILDWRPDREVVMLGGLAGDLSDFPAERFAAIPGRMRELRTYAYRELAFRAKAAAIEREPMVALVLACAALEGAHAALLRKLLTPALSDRTFNDLLREQGIYTLVEFTAVALMSPETRPAAEDIAACRKALEMRNSILHAKGQVGAYRFAAFSANELYGAYGSALKMYRIFDHALVAGGQGAPGT